MNWIEKLKDASPDDSSPDLAAIVKAINTNSQDLDSINQEIEEILRHPVESGDSFRLKYGCFYIARRNKSFRTMRKYAQLLYQEHPDIPVTKVLLAESLAAGETDSRLLRKALRVATEALESANTISGAFLSHCEIALKLAQAIGSEKEKASLLGQAETSIDRSLYLNPDYPKALALKARILALQGDFSGAFDLVNHAIDSESTSAPDYAIRISDHQLAKMEISYLSHGEVLRQELRSSLNEMRLAREQVLQLLGLLAAVIAFLVTGITVAIKLPTFNQSMRLVIVIAGAILVIFSGFGFSFGLPGRRRQILTLFLGIVMMILPFFILKVG